MGATQIEAYQKSVFEGPVGTSTRTFDVYTRGSGAPVVIMQELPGIGQQTLAFADALVDAGFQVWLPHLFGPIGRTSMGGNLVRLMCMRREFQVFAKRKSSAMTDWMRALCGDVKERTGARGVGVVGMCLTGNFAMTLIADDAVLAAVASQPSLPAPHMSSEEISAARKALDEKGAMHAYRFESDKLCTAAHFRTINRAFNDNAERVCLHTLPGKGHSVFTIDFDPADGPTADALRQIIDYFGTQLTDT